MAFKIWRRECCRGEQGTREIGEVATEYFTVLERIRVDQVWEDSLVPAASPQLTGDGHPVNSTYQKLETSSAFAN
jgi:hypothetical protein